LLVALLAARKGSSGFQGPSEPLSLNQQNCIRVRRSEKEVLAPCLFRRRLVYLLKSFVFAFLVLAHTVTHLDLFALLSIMTNLGL
jgi:hypothetical protein